MAVVVLDKTKATRVRRHRLMPPLQSWEYSEDAAFGHIRLFKLDDYEYETWRIKITLAPGVTADAEISTGVDFPDLTECLFNAQPEQGYSYPVPDGQDGIKEGFRFINGRAEFDVYSNGVSEERNETKPEIVITAVAEQVKNWLTVRQGRQQINKAPDGPYLKLVEIVNSSAEYHPAPLPNS